MHDCMCWHCYVIRMTPTPSKVLPFYYVLWNCCWLICPLKLRFLSSSAGGSLALRCQWRECQLKYSSTCKVNAVSWIALTLINPFYGLQQRNQSPLNLLHTSCACAIKGSGQVKRQDFCFVATAFSLNHNRLSRVPIAVWNALLLWSVDGFDRPSFTHIL